jgi:hypothetical protein
MTKSQQRDLRYAIALLAALALFQASAGGAAWIRATAGLICLGVVTAYVLGSDEVERALSMRAGAAAFGLVVTVALIAVVVGRPEVLAEAAPRLWAWLFALYMACWGVLRLARG